MPHDLNAAGRRTIVDQATVERRARDRDYHQARALFERAAAARTEDAAARNAHLELAELYEAAVGQAS